MDVNVAVPPSKDSVLVAVVDPVVTDKNNSK
jgi:hypothetical protein